MSENRELRHREHRAHSRVLDSEMSENQELSHHKHGGQSKVLDSEMSENRELSHPKHEVLDLLMSENQRLSHHKHEEPGKIYYKVLKERRPKVEFTVSSDINKTLLECNTWCKTEWDKEFRPRVELVSANVDLFDAINVFNTYDRKADASVTGTYVQRETYKHMEYKDEAGERLPRAGASVAAGVGRAHAEYSILEAEAKGPNVSAGVEISVAGLGAMAQAEVGSASAKAGPVSVKVGLGLDTGVSIGLTGVEAKFLGCGVSAGLKTSVSLLGSEVSCSVM